MESWEKRLNPSLLDVAGDDVALEIKLRVSKSNGGFLVIVEGENGGCSQFIVGGPAEVAKHVEAVILDAVAAAG